MPRSGRPKKAPGAKERLRAAALELFARKGVAATSTRAICARAGVTAPVLYHHFGNKLRLFREVMLDTLKDYRVAAYSAAEAGGTTKERLVQVLAAQWAITRKHPDFIRLMFRVLFAPEAAPPPLDCVAHAEEQIRFYSRLLEEGKRRGEVTGDPLEAAHMLMGMSILHTLRFLLQREVSLDATEAEIIVHCLLEGCGGAKARVR